MRDFIAFTLKGVAYGLTTTVFLLAVMVVVTLPIMVIVSFTDITALPPLFDLGTVALRWALLGVALVSILVASLAAYLFQMID
jgi:hypothetical protein